jgi:ABC-type Mn2+/Zn2+ transport system permease subunit
MDAVLKYAKAHVALVGALATWALGTFPPNSTGYHVATAIMAVLTALGVVAVPNRPKRRATR